MVEFSTRGTVAGPTHRLFVVETTPASSTAAPVVITDRTEIVVEDDRARLDEFVAVETGEESWLLLPPRVQEREREREEQDARNKYILGVVERTMKSHGTGLVGGQVQPCATRVTLPPCVQMRPQLPRPSQSTHTLSSLACQPFTPRFQDW